MRADRLISMVMLLQSHEMMTAEELSVELEVSPRTIYRDVEALNMAGVPIYTDRGPGGGIALIDSYRTTLTGMNEDEARALFMMSIPQSLVDLGVGQNLKSALYKLAAALPQDQIAQAAQTKQRIFLDSSPWKTTTEPVIHLETLQEALWRDNVLRVVFRGYFDSQIEIEVAPLGLVAKMNTWYLLGKMDGYIKVIKVKDILEVGITEKTFYRDENFNLELSWKAWCKTYQDHQPGYPVRAKIIPELTDKISRYLGEEVKYEIIKKGIEPTGEWVEVNLTFENFFAAREILLSLGRAIEVLEPQALRCSVIDYASQIIEFYRGR